MGHIKTCAAGTWALALSATLLTLVAGCAPHSALIANAQNAVKAKLRDPESAVFKDVTVYTEGVVCGEVNSKNAYGAMVGFGRFVYGARYQSDVEIDKDAQKLADDFCSNDVGKLVAFKRRELKSVQLGCEDAQNYEYSCTRAQQLIEEIATAEKTSSSPAIPAQIAAASASEPAAAPVMLFGAIPLGAVLADVAPCPKDKRSPAIYPCTSHMYAAKAEDRSVVTELTMNPALQPSWMHNPIFAIAREKQSNQIFGVDVRTELTYPAEASEVMSAFRKRFGEPQYLLEGDKFMEAKWDLGNMFADMVCAQDNCRIEFMTPAERKTRVAYIMANRVATAHRAETP